MITKESVIVVLLAIIVAWVVLSGPTSPVHTAQDKQCMSGYVYMTTEGACVAGYRP